MGILIEIDHCKFGAILLCDDLDAVKSHHFASPSIDVTPAQNVNNIDNFQRILMSEQSTRIPNVQTIGRADIHELFDMWRVQRIFDSLLDLHQDPLLVMLWAFFEIFERNIWEQYFIAHRYFPSNRSPFVRFFADRRRRADRHRYN